MTQGQFKRRVKRARRTIDRERANGRWQPSSGTPRPEQRLLRARAQAAINNLIGRTQ